MIKKYKYLLLISGFLILSGCYRNQDINICNYIDSNSEIQMAINQKDYSLIIPKSEKYIKLLQWAKNNTVGWRETPPVSYYSQIFIKQNHFRLLYSKGTSYVIIGIKINDTSKQYKKSIQKGELDFLLN